MGIPPRPRAGRYGVSRESSLATAACRRTRIPGKGRDAFPDSFPLRGQSPGRKTIPETIGRPAPFASPFCRARDPRCLPACAADRRHPDASSATPDLHRPSPSTRPWTRQRRAEPDGDARAGDASGTFPGRSRRHGKTSANQLRRPLYHARLRLPPLRRRRNPRAMRATRLRPKGEGPRTAGGRTWKTC